MSARMLLMLGVACSLVAGCGAQGHTDPETANPPPSIVEHETDGTMLEVAHPERFPVIVATRRDAAPELRATGAVAPDVSRAVPVVSLVSGRVVDLRVRLGDHVTKGQLLMRIQSADIAAASSDYRKARADETLARAQLERANALYERGAIARKDLEVSQDAAAKAAVDVETTAQHLRVLGIDPDRPPSEMTDVVAPVTGVITEQNVTPAAGVKSLDASLNLFTISDLSHVWILCDVYENDLAGLQLGDAAEIRLAAYPDRPLVGRVDNIGAILDPTIRTAKVRVEAENPGLLRIGMFVTATFRGQTVEPRAVVPASAVLHLHDREWVYVPVGDGRFQRVEVVSGQLLPGNLQEIRSGIRPGDRVTANALVLQNTVDQ